LTFTDVKDKDGQLIKSAIRDVEALVCVFAIAIFMNALDKRTYMPFVQAGAALTPEELGVSGPLLRMAYMSPFGFVHF
jgi:hypothetical protein